jgi:hypothetical protein
MDIVKTFPADFPALTHPAPDAEVLAAQINAAITSAEVVGTILDDTTITIQTDVDPSGADLTAIDAVCAAHTGTPFVNGVQKVFAEAVQTETGTAYVTKAALQSGYLRAADYLINWYAELAVAAADATSGVLGRVLWNGTERAESSNNTAFYDCFSGSVIVSADELSAPTLDVQLRRVGTSNTAQIRRIRLSIAPLR